METTTQFTSTSLRNMFPEPCVDRTMAANARPARPKIFPEAGIATRSAPMPDDRKLYATAVQTLSRQKRGGVIGTYGKTSVFRECRGGDALAASSSDYVKFDQFRRRQTRGTDGRGTCEGLAREAMRRIDRSYNDGAQATDLRTEINDMRLEMATGRAHRSGLYSRIQAFQDDPASLGLRHLRRSSNVDLNPEGTSTRQETIAGLLESMSDIPRGGLAYIRVGIYREDETGMGVAGSGHVLLVQRLPPLPHGDGHVSPDRYALFDPNNGIFTYENLGHVNTALRAYMDAAYTELGDVAAPNRVFLFSPPTSRDWSSLPRTPAVPTGLPDRAPEPPELYRYQPYPHGGSGSDGGLFAPGEPRAGTTRRNGA
jgi:hypothetical protein